MYRTGSGIVAMPYSHVNTALNPSWRGRYRDVL
jgi:hypothetical protein